MSPEDARRLTAYTERLGNELVLLRLAGLEHSAHARALREARSGVQEAIRAAAAARAVQGDHEAANERQLEAEREAREKRAADELAAAIAFLESILSGGIVARDEILRRADDAGIGTASLLSAAQEVGAVQLAGYVDGRIRHTSPRAWAPRAFALAAGWSQEDLSLS